MQNASSSPERRRQQKIGLQLALQDASHNQVDSGIPPEGSAQSTGVSPLLSPAKYDLVGKGQLPSPSKQSSDSDTIPAVQVGHGNGKALREAKAASSLPASDAGNGQAERPRILVTVAHSLPGAPQIKHPKVLDCHTLPCQHVLRL